MVDEYSITLGKLFKWLLAGVDLREVDVQMRRDKKAKLKEERRMAIEGSEERQRMRDRDLEAAAAVIYPYVS